MINITETTKNAIQEMVRESFLCNARVDRMKSVLGVKLAYNQTANLLHIGIAHKFPLWADILGDLLEGYNQDIIYGDIPLQNKDYSSLKDVLDELLELVVDYQNKLNMCAKVAFDNVDMHTYSGILDVVEEFSKTVEQVILLVDKANVYGNDISFDAHIKNNFWILG